MIRTEIHDGVGEVILDRAEKRNALTPAMTDALIEAVRTADDDPSCNCILLRGEGDAFCAGFDLKMCYEIPGTLGQLLRKLSVAVRTLRHATKPVVIASHGAAIAGGCALLGGADYVVTESNAKLGYPVVTLGISPAVSAPTLIRSVGAGNARERLLEPRVFRGEEAMRIGLAHECVQDASTCDLRARKIARSIASKPPHAMMVTKRWLNEVDGTDTDDEFERALNVSLALVGNDEEHEALQAMWGAKHD